MAERELRFRKAKKKAKTRIIKKKVLEILYRFEKRPLKRKSKKRIEICLQTFAGSL